MARRAALWLALLGRTASAANYVGGQCVVGVTSGDLFPDKCEYGTQFTQTVAADYSLLWEVAYYDSYKFVKLSLIHISEPTRPERISYAVFCLKKKK